MTNEQQSEIKNAHALTLINLVLNPSLTKNSETLKWCPLFSHLCLSTEGIQSTLFYLHQEHKFWVEGSLGHEKDI